MKKIYRKEAMLSVNQFAEAIGMGRTYVYDLVDKGPNQGGVVAFRFGGLKGIRIPSEELERFKNQKLIDAGV